MPWYRDLAEHEVPESLLALGEATAAEAARELGIETPRIQWYRQSAEGTGWFEPRAELGHTRGLQNIIWVNVDQSALSMRETVRHEAHHRWEYMNGRIPRLRGQITPAEYHVSEASAEAFAKSGRGSHAYRLAMDSGALKSILDDARGLLSLI